MPAPRKRPAKGAKVENRPEVPLNERPGYCRHCAGYSYKLKYINHALIRICRGCGDHFDLAQMKSLEVGYGQAK